MKRRIGGVLACLILWAAGCISPGRQTEPIMAVHVLGGKATGFVVAAKPGHLLVATCAHVKNYDTPTLQYSDGTWAGGQWVYLNAARDVALIDIATDRQVQPVRLAEPSDVRRYRPVTAYGHAYGRWLMRTRGELMGMTRDDNWLTANVWACMGYSGGPLYAGESDLVLGMISRGPTPWGRAVMTVPAWWIAKSIEESGW